MMMDPWQSELQTIPMPGFSIIYIKRTEKTPKITRITFTFPDGQEVNGWQQGSKSSVCPD